MLRRAFLYRSFFVYYSWWKRVWCCLFLCSTYFEVAVGLGFLWNGVKKITLSDTNTILLATFGLTGGFYFLYLLNLHPRASMLSFNLYWVGIMVFLIAGIQLRVYQNNVRVLFLIGLFFTVTADLYYILPPEERVYELTYIFIRVINTIGEFLIVNHILRFYAFKNK